MMRSWSRWFALAGPRDRSVRPQRAPVRWPDTRPSDWDPASDVPPPIDGAGLQSIEQRAEHARPLQLQRWIDELESQAAAMAPDDDAHARALRLKFERLLEQPRLLYRRG